MRAGFILSTVCGDDDIMIVGGLSSSEQRHTLAKSGQSYTVVLSVVLVHYQYLVSIPGNTCTLVQYQERRTQVPVVHSSATVVPYSTCVHVALPVVNSAIWYIPGIGYVYAYSTNLVMYVLYVCRTG